MAGLEERITHHIHDFDPISLLHLLRLMGYRLEEIFFRGHTGIASQPCLIQGIQIQHEPVRKVTVSLHTGLLGPQSPLPSYFLKKVDEGMLDGNAFADFMGFFDHPILQSFILSAYPELNPSLYPDWEQAKRDRLMMLDLKSCSRLHWVCRLVFPELQVKVEKALLNRSIETTHIRLGAAALGSDAVFGKRSSLPVHGKRITLFAEQELTGQGEPWPRAIRHRLEASVFPMLKSMSLSMEIFLVIRAQKSWARLHRESYLGYDMLRSEQAQPRRVLIFSGQVR